MVHCKLGGALWSTMVSPRTSHYVHGGGYLVFTKAAIHEFSFGRLDEPAEMKRTVEDHQQHATSRLSATPKLQPLSPLRILPQSAAFAGGVDKHFNALQKAPYTYISKRSKSKVGGEAHIAKDLLKEGAEAGINKSNDARMIAEFYAERCKAFRHPATNRPVRSTLIVASATALVETSERSKWTILEAQVCTAGVGGQMMDAAFRAQYESCGKTFREVREICSRGIALAAVNSPACSPTGVLANLTPKGLKLVELPASDSSDEDE